MKIGGYVCEGRNKCPIRSCSKFKSLKWGCFNRNFKIRGNLCSIQNLNCFVVLEGLNFLCCSRHIESCWNLIMMKDLMFLQQWLWREIFWGVTRGSPLKLEHCTSLLLHTGFLLDLFFSCEGGQHVPPKRWLTFIWLHDAIS
jgi:hypothetical protein